MRQITSVICWVFVDKWEQIIVAIFSLTLCNLWHTPTLLLQLWLGTGHETSLLGWATFGLSLSCLTIITQLQQQTTMLCDWLDNISLQIQRTDRAKTRPQRRCRKVHGKQPDSLSLPYWTSQPCSLRLEDCYKAYRMTRSSAVVAAMWPDNTTNNIHKQVNKYTDK